MVGGSALERALADLGWRSERHDPVTLRSVHQTAEGVVTIYLRRSDNWLVGSVVPFLSTGGKNPFELSRWLLRINRDMVQAKFAYDEDGDVVLSIEWPTEALDAPEIAVGLRALLGYTIEYRGVLRKASTP